MNILSNKILKKIINSTIISIFFFTFMSMIVEEYNEQLYKKMKDDTSSYNTNKINNQYDDKTNSLENQQKFGGYPKEEIINEYKGYEVIAKLEIPQIKLETYILNNFSENTLNVSVTKFWGPNPNEIGNLCIAGHNFQNKNMFHNLKKLKVGDIFFISDNVIGRVEYEIYDIYKVFPENVNCLSQNTNGNKEVTLITCTYDSKKRIIVKARELDEIR